MDISKEIEAIKLYREGETELEERLKTNKKIAPITCERIARELSDDPRMIEYLTEAFISSYVG